MADVKVTVGADTNELSSGLTKADNAIKNFSAKTSIAGQAVGKMQAAMVTAGAVGSKAMAGLQSAMGPLLALFGAFAGLKGLADAAGQINDLSQRFGESAESIQRLKLIADQSGTSLETVAKAMNKAELAAVAAASGNQEMNDAFLSLGVSAEVFAGLPIEERLTAFAKGYEENTNKAAALNAMVKIMGKSASELVPMFAQGRDGIKDMMEEATVASSDAIGRIDEVQDRFGEVFSTLKVWAMDALGFVIDLVDKMGVGIASAIAFVSNLGDGIDAAKQAYNDTLEGGLLYLEEQKAAREERSNKISSANIEQIRQETAEEEAAKTQSKAGQTSYESSEDFEPVGAKSNDEDYDLAIKQAEQAKKAQLAAQRKAAKDAKSKAIDDASDRLNDAQDNLSSLKNRRNNLVSGDELRRIGGGFAKSNYNGLSKEAINLQKQIDAAQKSVNYLKNIYETLKKTDPLDGITN